MNSIFKRAIISVVIFIAVYFLSDFIIGNPTYNAILKGIEFLAAIVADGFYWVGSNSYN